MPIIHSDPGSDSKLVELMNITPISVDWPALPSACNLGSCALLTNFELLKFAKQQGDILIVGINSDESVKRLKGDDRPFNNALVREQQLLQLPWVDKVVVFEEDTPIDKLQEYKPNVIVKGGDYTFDTVVGNDIAQVIIFPTVEGFSTSNIVEKVNGNKNWKRQINLY